MLFLYNIGIFLYGLIVRLIAPFNTKANLFIQGRKNIFHKIEQQINREEKHVWFHFASLGEFEQGRPVLEKIKSMHPQKRVIITFFSPSGYEVRKHYPLAAGVFYLPLDTHENALRFIQAINPEIAIFTKYEFWHHYFESLSAKNIPLFLISGIFRADQVFFKFYGSFNRKVLKHVNWFFVQNQESVELLATLNIENVSIAGDTRFDRVAENAAQPMPLPLVQNFCAAAKVFIAGSSWPADEVLIKSLSEKLAGWKIILAPHEIGADHLTQIESLYPNAMRFTELNEQNTSEAKVLIIDNIGLLSSIYQYADLAYIGGGFGVGIHNTLEAAAYGIPVIFGPNYNKFQEAKDLIALGAAKSINDELSLHAAFQLFENNQKAGLSAKDYVSKKKGATENIYLKIKSYLN
jgi:3-deoxy-D-manno-octulosonic-acid transferase